MLRVTITTLVLLLTAACQTTKKPPLTAEQVAAGWAGTRTGTFSHGCTGTLIVTNVRKHKANVLYRWRGNCGSSSSGEISDPHASISENTLRVDLGSGYKIMAEMLNNGSFKTKFSYPGGKPAFATFNKS